MNSAHVLQQPRRNSLALCSTALLGLLLPAAAAGQPGGESGQAQPEPPGTTQELRTADAVRANLETSYLAYPIPIHGLPPLIFECNIAPHFFVNEETWPFALVLTPKIVLRMFNEESTPARSPSFMPRITAYAWFQQRVRGKPTFYASVMLSHHSNGQAGPFFAPDGSIS